MAKKQEAAVENNTVTPDVVPMSKSEQIRQLAAQGKKVGEIAKLLGVRYQFAYNVLKRASKKQ